jgi:microcystin degradation protein MlrC
MRVFAGGIVTETNTFSPMPTGLADYRVVRAADLTPDKPHMGSEGMTIDRFRRRTQEHGWDFVFSLYAWAEPAGLTVRSVYESLRDEILADLRAALPVDIVLLPLHGAMVAEGYDDCEGDLITRVRQIVGPDVVIGVELDLHCHLTQRMVDGADLIVIYKEYPHVDIVTRADDLFRLAAAAAQGQIKPAMALYDCRMIGMYLTPYEPMRSFVDEMSAMEGRDGVLSLSLAHCFPWGDVPDCGTRMLAITDNDSHKAVQLAERFGQRLFGMRHAVRLNTLSLDDALDRALASDRRPVVVADQADNAGGGAPSDSTFVLKALLERGVTDAGLAMMWDPIVVQVAKSAGVGAKLDVRLGGKMGPMSGDPLDLTVTVRGIVEDMVQEWPQEGDPMRIPCGDAVALHCEGIDIIVNSRRTQTFSPQVFSHFGIDPMQKRLLVVKSTQHFYAGFAPIAGEIIYMAAPGAIAPIFENIPYTRVDLHKFPWVDNPFES